MSAGESSEQRCERRQFGVVESLRENSLNRGDVRRGEAVLVEQGVVTHAGLSEAADLAIVSRMKSACAAER